MRKSLAQLKRDAKSGQLKAVMIYRYGEEIPDRLKGVRPIVDSNSVAIFFRNADGKKSELQIKNATLCEYTEKGITIFAPGERPLNEAEQRVMDAWEAISNSEKYQKQREYDLLTDCSTTYWMRESFFTERNMKHLLGYDFVKGMKLNWSTGNVIDKSIRGEKIMEYAFV